MNSNSTKQNHRRRRSRKSKHLFILILAAIMNIVFGVFLVKTIFSTEKNPEEPIPAFYASTDTGNMEETQPTTEYIEEDSNWNLALANKWNPIPENRDINLVKIEGGERVDKRIKEPLMEMLEAAKAANWDQLPKVVSGYRTMEKQQKIYDDKIQEYKREGYPEDDAKSMAEQWVAIPGTSEHQLGLAVDINGATYDLYFWLQENSYKYGFIFRYPGAKTEITGVAEEVWHYRYVGVEAATEIYERGICLEEYLEQ